MTKKYFYFGKAANGTMVPIFECVAEADPTAAETTAIYSEIVRQKGLGVPRPTHYGAIELTEIVETESNDDPVLMSTNGEIVH